jgi:hypothetical protein
MVDLFSIVTFFFRKDLLKLDSHILSVLNPELSPFSLLHWFKFLVLSANSLLATTILYQNI